MSNKDNSLSVITVLFEENKTALAEINRKIDHFKFPVPKEINMQNIERRLNTIQELVEDPPGIHIDEVNKLLDSNYIRETEAHNKLIDKLTEISGKIREPRIDRLDKNFHFICDFRNAKNVMVIVSLSFLFLITSALNIKQFMIYQQMKDNDIKYRYIKLKGKGITNKEVNLLEYNFHVKRNHSWIKELYKDVERVERQIDNEQKEIIRDMIINKTVEDPGR